MLPRSNLYNPFLLLVTLIIVSACNPQPPSIDIGEEFHFETLDNNKMSQYPWSDTKIYLLWDQNDIAEIEAWVSPHTLTLLNAVDFSSEAVVAVFHGHKPDYDYQVVVERYGIREEPNGDRKIVLLAGFWENGPGLPSHPASSSPYHLIKIKKDPRLSSATQAEMHRITRYFHPDIQN